MFTLPKPATERKKMKREMMAASGVDRLSELPDSVLLHILSLLKKMKAIARTSVLSTRWRFLWKYVFPQFAFKNSSLKNLVLHSCELEPSVSVSWTRLISLTIGDLKLTDRFMEMVLSGCPNLEFLKLDSFFGLHYLEIRSPKLETLIIKNHYTNEDDPRMEVVTPHVQCLQLLGSSHERLVWLTNVASVVTMLVDNECFRWDDNDKVDKECKYLKEVLHSLVHAKNLELGRWCIELLSVLVLDGWQAPASSRRSLTLKAGLVQQHFPAICSLLQSSPDLETFIIDMSWQSVGDLLSRLINEDENGKKFEKHIFDCSLLHLRTIKITNFYVPLRSNKFMMPLVKYLLKNAEVLEKMVITARLCHNKVQEDDVPLSFVEMAQEFLSFPRSSKHAAVVFSYS